MKCNQCNNADSISDDFRIAYSLALRETSAIFNNEISLASVAGQHIGMSCNDLKEDYEKHSNLAESILRLKDWMVRRGTGTTEQLRRLDELESESRSAALDALSVACDMKCDWALAMGCNLNS